MELWIGLISTLSAILLLVFRRYCKQRDDPKEQYDKDIEKFDKRLSNRDGVAISGAFEQLHTDSCDPGRPDGDAAP